MTDITQLTAERIEKFLPGALEKAIKAYDEHCRCGTQPDKDGKVTSKAVTDHFKAHQAIGAHIVLLLKLAYMLPRAGTGGERAALEALMRAAEEEVAAFEADQKES
jgi:hypothetical protein